MANKYKALASNWKSMQSKDFENVSNRAPMTKAKMKLESAIYTVNNDIYGELSKISSSNKLSDLSKVFIKLEKIKNYSMRIMSVVDSKEGEYAKVISKQFERVSMIDIRSFTSGRISAITKNSFKNTVDQFDYLTTQDIDILTLFENGTVLSLRKIYMSNDEFSKMSYEDYLKKYVNSKYEHNILIDEELMKMYALAGYIPIVGSGITIYEGVKGKTLTGENLTKNEANNKVFLGGWTAVGELSGLGPASKVASKISKAAKFNAPGKFSTDTVLGMSESFLIDKGIEEYNKNFPKKDSSNSDVNIKHNIKGTNWAK